MTLSWNTLKQVPETTLKNEITSLYTQPHADGKSGEVLLSTRVFWSFTAKCAWGLVLKLKKDHRMA